MRIAARCIAVLLFCIVIFTGDVRIHGKRKIPVLLYHHLLREEEIAPDNENGMIVSLESFEEQMKFLYENGFHTVTLDELYGFLYENKELPDKSVMIQFDDGYYSALVYAYPVLQKYGFCSVMFLITGTTGETQEEFRSDKLIFIAKDSMEGTQDVFTYASHTHDLHREDKKSSLFMLATKEEIMDDLTGSFSVVSNSMALAYPRGQFNSGSIEAVREVGVAMAFTVNYGYVAQDSDPYRLNRILVYGSTTMRDFRRYLNGRLRNSKRKTVNEDMYEAYFEGVKLGEKVPVRGSTVVVPDEYRQYRMIVDEGTKKVFIRE